MTTNLAPTANAHWPWPDSLDALVAAADYHFLVLENDRVRVLEVIIPPGAFVPLHTHRWPAVMQVVSASDFVRRDGDGKVLLDTRTLPTTSAQPGAIWSPPLPPHSVENVGPREIRLFTVEVKNPGGIP